MSDILKYFHLEAQELLEKIKQESLALEREEDKSGPLKELKRSAHLLKGTARLVELFELGDEAQEVEDYLAKLEGKGVELSPGHISELLEKVDSLQEALRQTLHGEGAEEKQPEAEK